MPKEKTKNALAVWDITIPKNDMTPEQLWHKLKRLCEQFVFQEERGELNGYEHFQVRVRRNPKCREGNLIHDCLQEGIKFHVTPTTTKEHKGFSYVMKADTRVAGPWKDDHKWESMKPRLLQLPPLPWHEKIYTYLKQRPHLRKILCILDGPGKKGKSYLRKWLRWLGLAVIIPPQQKAEDIANLVMCQPEARCYVIDIPRSEKPSQALWAGIEMLKDGYCYDKRFKWRDRDFDNPHIIVLTNERPNAEYLSADRWVFIDLVNVVMPAQAYDETEDDFKIDDLINDIQVPYAVPSATLPGDP